MVAHEEVQGGEILRSVSHLSENIFDARDRVGVLLGYLVEFPGIYAESWFEPSACGFLRRNRHGTSPRAIRGLNYSILQHAINFLANPLTVFLRGSVWSLF